MDSSVKNRGVRVTLAGLGINLALGILYTWSVIKGGIPADWKWSDFEQTLPYSTAVLVFSLMMVPAGRLQDRFGPRLVATIGGLLVGLGMILASAAESSLVLPWMEWISVHLASGAKPTAVAYFLGFGLLAGTGIGFGYAAATPPAVKWFPPAKTGLIAGLVVSGFGLASVYAAPLATKLIEVYQLQQTMLILGVAFLIVVVGLAQLLVAPPKGFVPTASNSGVKKTATLVVQREDFRPTEMLATRQFYLCWLLYAIGAGAGLMIISQLGKNIATQVGLSPLKQGFWLVAACGVGNGAGRILAGMLSDRLGRRATLQGCFAIQAVVMLALSVALPNTSTGSFASMLVLSALVGANYGANLAIFPSITKDYYGLKNFGVNYGLLFTAWGFGGFLLAQAASKIKDQVGELTYNYYGAAALLLLAVGVAFALKPPHAVQDTATRTAEGLA